jgi:hypothetical protein
VTAEGFYIPKTVEYKRRKKMKKLLLGVFVGLLILGITAPVWALEVTVGGEFRFRARQRTDFDLQAFNLNGGAGALLNRTTGAIFFPQNSAAAGAGNTFDLLTWDAPVGQLTYGGSALMRNGNLQQITWGNTPLVFNIATGQFVANAVAAGTTTFFFDGTAAEEHFGYNLATGRINPFRAASLRHGVELSRSHADAGNNDRDYIYDRVRVSVDAKIVEGLRAYVMFENYSDWGLSSTTAANEPRTFGGNGSTSIYGDRQGLNIRFAWVDFVLPKTPIHVKIGRQPLALGHGILLDTRTWGGDMAYVYAPIGPVTLGAVYGTMIENNVANADDAHFWGVHADFAINPSNKISTFYRYVWNRLGRYNDITSTGFANTGGVANSNRKLEQNQHGWGITFDGRINLTPKVALFYAAEADIIWGQYTDWKEPRRDKAWGYWDFLNARTPLQLQEDLYQSAWGYGVQLGMDFGMVKIDIAHSYGTGDKTRASNTRFSTWDGTSGSSNAAGQFAGATSHSQWTTGRRVETFDAWGGDNMYSPWSTDIFMGSAKSANYGGVGVGTTGFTRRWGYTGDFGDIIMLKPTLSVKPLDNLTADISYAAFWKTSNTNSNGAGLGAVADGEQGTFILWKSNLNSRVQPNKQKINNFLGQEINAHLTWFPYKNLMVKGWAGVFFPGDWFKVQQRMNNADDLNIGAATGATGLVQDGHDTVNLRPAWAMQVDFIVTF